MRLGCTVPTSKIHCAVVGTASGSVHGQPGTRDIVAIRQAKKTRTDWPGWHNNLNRYAAGQPCTEHVYVAKLAFFEGGASLSSNISQGTGYCTPTTVGVKKLE